MQPKFRIVLYRGAYYAAWIEDGNIRRQALRTKDRVSAQAALKGFAASYEIINRPGVITVEFVWNAYKDSLGNRPTVKTMKYEWKPVGAFFGTRPAESLTEEDSIEYRLQRLKSGRREATVTTELGRLRAALHWALAKGIINTMPPFAAAPSSPPRDLRMTREQIAIFLNACEMPHVKLFVILALTTAGRMGALLDLTWDRVDFEHAVIYLHNPNRATSNKRRATVPMNNTLRAALSEAKASAMTDHVIEWAGRPVASVKTGIKSAGKRCKMLWVSPHVFRHTSASLMAADGVPIGMIAQILGHTDSRITERTYARFSPNYMKEAARALEIDMSLLQAAATESSVVQVNSASRRQRELVAGNPKLKQRKGA